MRYGRDDALRRICEFLVVNAGMFGHHVRTMGDEHSLDRFRNRPLREKFPQLFRSEDEITQ